MRRKWFLGMMLSFLLAGLAGFVVLGEETQEVYGSADRGASFHSAAELRDAVIQLYEGWDTGMNESRIRYDDEEVTITLESSGGYKDIRFLYDRGYPVVYLRYEVLSRNNVNLNELEDMIRFVCTLLSKETAGLPEEAGQNFKKLLDMDPDTRQIYNWFKRINGVNYAYWCGTTNSSWAEGMYNYSEISMNISFCDRDKRYYGDTSQYPLLSLSQLLEGRNDTAKDGSGLEVYRVSGAMNQIRLDDKGEVYGMIVDGNDQIPVRVNSIRHNSIEEYKNATAFFVMKDGSFSRTQEHSEYTVLYCE